MSDQYADKDIRFLRYRVNSAFKMESRKVIRLNRLFFHLQLVRHIMTLLKYTMTSVVNTIICQLLIFTI
jgi:hypothetical protein